MPPFLPFIREADFAVRRPWHTGARRLLDYLLIYVQEGEVVVHLEGVEHRLGPDRWCFLQPGDLHTLKGATNTITPFIHFDVFYNPAREQSFPTQAGQVELATFGDLLQPRLDEALGIHVPLDFEPSEPWRLREALFRAIAVWQGRAPLHLLEAQYLLTGIVVALLRDHGYGDIPAPQGIATMSWITSYLSFRLTEPISVVDMARRANLSVSRFHALFRQHFGCAPHQYLLRLRCHRAQELLGSTDATLHEIAHDCGFANAYHLSRVFKRITGVSPRTFRTTTSTTVVVARKDEPDAVGSGGPWREPDGGDANGTSGG
jgi:AraC-like DNA-binding protein